MSTHTITEITGHDCSCGCCTPFYPDAQGNIALPDITWVTLDNGEEISVAGTVQVGQKIVLDENGFVQY